MDRVEVSGGGELERDKILAAVDGAIHTLFAMGKVVECDRLNAQRPKLARALSTPQARPDGGEAVCYRLHTGDPPRSWSWMDGKPTASVHRLAQEHGYQIEYAHPAPAPDVARLDGGEVCWQRSVLLREGHWGQWEQYHDLYNEGRPEMVGRFKCKYRPLYTRPAPAPDAENGVPITPIAGDVARLVEAAKEASSSLHIHARSAYCQSWDDADRETLTALDEALAPFTAAQQEGEL